MITCEKLDLLSKDELWVLHLVVTNKNYRQIFKDHIDISKDKLIYTVKAICLKLDVYPTRAQALRHVWTISVADNLMQRRIERESGIVHNEMIEHLPIGKSWGSTEL